MITVFVHRDGRTEEVQTVDSAWLQPGSGAIVWVDMVQPGEAGASLLRDVFHFHELAVEDALGEAHHPKIEAYDGYLYLILHGINFRAADQQFATNDTDFFLGPTYLVTVHDATSRSVPLLNDAARRNPHIVGEGALALLHRIVDAMVDHYAPEVEKLEDRIDVLEKEVFEAPRRDVVRRILALKHDVGWLRRVSIPQRDVVGRLARREFPQIDVEMAYRFRDVYDHLVRLSDEALIFQDRITGVLEAHISNVSNRLNEVMKVLTVIATIFMPLSVLTGFYGMNVGLPHLPGGDGMQWLWISGIMVVASVLMLAWFRRKGWI